MKYTDEQIEEAARMRKLRRKIAAVRRKAFPAHTDPYSRHVHIMADVLSFGKEYAMFSEEPKHCAESLLVTLINLWEARIELAALRQAVERKPNAN